MNNIEKNIANWNQLTEEQKQKAKTLVDGQGGLNPVVVHPAAKHFKKKNG